MRSDFLSEDIIKQLGLSALSPEEQQQVLEKFSTVLFQGIALKSLQALNEDQKDELEKIMEKDPENLDNMIAFFRLEVPHFDRLVAEVVGEVQRAMAGAK